MKEEEGNTLKAALTLAIKAGSLRNGEALIRRLQHHDLQEDEGMVIQPASVRTL